MILEFIKINLKLFISISWLVFSVVYLIVLAGTTKKNTKAENKALYSILLLIIGTIIVVVYNTSYGSELLLKILNDFGVTNISFTLVVIALLYLIVKTFKMSIKIQTLNSMVEKIDQRYSINENHSEYEKRKNNPRNYRSQ